MEQNRKEKEKKDAQDQREAEFRSLEDKYKKLRQQMKTNQAKSSVSATPKKAQEQLCEPRKKGECNF